ncbi:hypothetical protein FNF27_07404 [Cafeteria roenbergensis]|uniref:Restriction endonuclease type IV Mrr domain-containing protein n=1 Tax=Cafeteria roenbergensis TaxID=33653 RepID=A0A5A8C2E6_CAFRO|nr:hypothetical protein FNF31_07886 [Cafeteria roenbergensis]KAA0146827.1 hypothetical protein FNF29_07803 [Cafeteria roenbergensis]KAA0164351.1 hypothetical protein FNF28_03891 [Cafeteria roenbergensis]KAA0167076.1 hypothetical protein FNF27_07404 [Cafeteria roenbergensis]|eukprot:KAA0146827.1 hypothetical protein FNF29_07803 [Cafeteria roenbergensis]
MRLKVFRDGAEVHKAAKLIQRAKSKRATVGRKRWTEPVKPTSQERGEALERRVGALFERMGYTVRRNVHIKSDAGHRSEIDVIATSRLPWRRTWYIECKNYSRPLPLHSVAMFKEVLVQNSLPLSRGLLVTTATLTPRVRAAGIRVWDGQELLAAERRVARASWLLWSIKLGAGVAALYAVVVASAPALVALEEKGWAHELLTQPLAGDRAAEDPGSFVARSPIQLATDHNHWWSRVLAAAGSAAGDMAGKAGSKLGLERLSQDMREGSRFLRDKLRGLVGGGPDGGDERH